MQVKSTDMCRQISRRRFLQQGAGALALQAAVPHALRAQARRGPSHREILLNQGWMFGEDTAATERVDLPHCVTPLSWQRWDPASWQKVWTYRREFASPVAKDSKERVFLYFDGVLSGATPTLNGTELEANLGGFLPWEREMTELLRVSNELSVKVDGRWLNVPPSGSPEGPTQVDYLIPAGIHRKVSLRIVPETFLSDVFAKPIDVLKSSRKLEVRCKLDSQSSSPQSMRVEAVLLDGATVVGRESKTMQMEKAGETEVLLEMNELNQVRLWSPEVPVLCTLRVSLHDSGGLVHEYLTRVGFREARFEVDGFYLNGEKRRIFGLNRHELFPYVGFAMPDRVMRKDAERIRHEYQCNAVRCSHYPQTEAFLDACDELGLMVWEEVPGWQYLGDPAWQQLLLRDVRRMIVRDRNHPSIIVWGVRVNESRNDVALYTKTKAVARELDDSRQTSGTMTRYSTADWVQDVFAYDDYHARPDGSVAMHEPLPDVPFFFSEGIGQYQYPQGKGFKQYYRRAGDQTVFREQARLHAQGHDRAAEYDRCGGLIAWCAYDYASLKNGYDGLKCPGIADTFRIPKLGAAFYRSQVKPQVKPVIEPSFYWDFGQAEEGGLGKDALIYSNCDRLVVTVGSEAPVTVQSEREAFPHLEFPPFRVHLSAAREDNPELRLEGYLGERLVLTRRFSSDRLQDKLVLQADDAEIRGAGSDATRVWFAVCDKYGAMCRCLEGEVMVTLHGQGVMVGDPHFVLADTGGVGAVWVRSKAGMSGIATVHATHPRSGMQTISIRIAKVSGEM